MMHPLRAHIEAISKVTDEEFEYILSHFTTVKLKKHHLLVREGELVKYEYFVLKGCLRAYMTDEKSGKEYTYQFAAENWWISERDAFLNHTPAKTAIECLEDCELLAITFDDTLKVGRELWKYEHYKSVKSAHGFVALQKRLQLMIMGSAKERFEHFVKQYPHLYSRIPKATIATYLGVTRETISRLYRK